ncbi:MAG: hypothetical protein H5U02_00185 [Clostridia bacterium]|nr:hypothetical protein [Clostridia bacterium]
MGCAICGKELNKNATAINFAVASNGWVCPECARVLHPLRCSICGADLGGVTEDPSEVIGPGALLRLAQGDRSARPGVACDRCWDLVFFAELLGRIPELIQQKDLVLQRILKLED